VQDYPLHLRLIADIHIGEDRSDRASSKGLPLIKEFVSATNKDQPQALIDLGDRVMQTNYEEDRKNLNRLTHYFNQLTVPRYHVLGNHDMLHLNHRINQTALNLPKERSHTIDVGSYTLVMWNASVDITREGASLPYEDVKWLEQTLMMTDRPCLIFTHIPLDDDALHDPRNRHEAQMPYFATYPQNPFVRKIIEQSGNVVACFAGHRHVHRHNEINGVHYVTVDCFSRRSKENPDEPIAAYADLKIDENGKVSYELQGKEPQRLSFQKRPFL
jgi:Icc protein